MQREIKFRAWNTLAKRMEYECILTAETRVVEPDGESYDFPVMQFTGLRLNGREIYEGDILERPGHKRRIVAYRVDAFVLIPVGHETNDGLYRVHGFIGDGKAEVIGNIYENPELVANQSPKEA